MELKPITVRAVTEDGRVAYWEPTAAGEVWIVGDGQAYTVPATPGVRALLTRGLLVEVVPDTADRATSHDLPSTAEPDPRAGPAPNVDVGQDADPRVARRPSRKGRP